MSAGRPRLVIGLVNNMNEAAAAGAERQFGDLLREAGADFELELRLFRLPQVSAGRPASGALDNRYLSAEQLPASRLDGLVVTGAEPRAADLASEPYWDALCKVIDWAATTETSAVWSCLAAHAAALRLAGVKRRRLPAKRSGVFACHRASDHPLALALPDVFRTPHSRCNELDEADLREAGCEILSRSPQAGADSFLAPGAGLQLCFQGHPEYEADTLLREYGRDVGRFLNGEQPAHPATPAGALSAQAEWRLTRLAEQARRRPSPSMLPAYLEVLGAERPASVWRAPAAAIFRAWLEQAAERRGASRLPAAKWTHSAATVS